MCGYIEINGQSADPIMWQPELSLFDDLIPKTFKRYYPAFGQDSERTIDIIIEEQGQLKSVAATWWYDCVDSPQGLQVGPRTTFNARNLASPYWQPALNQRRAVVIATGLGESKRVGKTKHQYYMQSAQPFVLGALYQKFADNKYSCAVITRDAHPKMQPYHDHAFPGFLPANADFLRLWLAKDVQHHAQITDVLAHPTLYPSLVVQRVKSYKDKQTMKSFQPVMLQSDIPAAG